ncbi:MAG: SEL1-like repeat protein [Notoacmeibacter sp.]
MKLIATIFFTVFCFFVSAGFAAEIKPVAPVAETAPEKNRFGSRPEDAAYGAFQRGLYLTALKLALPEATKGDLASQMLVAEIYARGLGLPKDPIEASRWYMEAAQQGNAEAQLQSALILLGDKPLDRSNANRDEALLMLQAASDAGNAFAAFNLAQILIGDTPGEESLRKAAPLFEKAAAANISGAHYALSQFYLKGTGGKTLDGAKTLFHLTRAAELGLDTAQLDLGTALVDGLLGEKDFKTGFLWMRRAADSGNLLAAIRLAKLYIFGLGVEPNPVTAASWYIRAKRAGLTDIDLDDFMDGLTDEERAAALIEANTRG